MTTTFAAIPFVPDQQYAGYVLAAFFGLAFVILVGVLERTHRQLSRRVADLLEANEELNDENDRLAQKLEEAHEDIESMDEAGREQDEEFDKLAADFEAEKARADRLTEQSQRQIVVLGKSMRLLLTESATSWRAEGMIQFARAYFGLSFEAAVAAWEQMPLEKKIAFRAAYRDAYGEQQQQQQQQQERADGGQDDDPAAGVADAGDAEKGELVGRLLRRAIEEVGSRKGFAPPHAPAYQSRRQQQQDGERQEARREEASVCQ